jgi:hypothetical protein
MGLDMYLHARIRRFKPFLGEHPDPKRDALLAAAEACGLPSANNIDDIAIEREVAYWRKANQIHRWFVDHCQGGVDECQRAYVPREKLTELLGLCHKIKSTAKTGTMTTKINVLREGRLVEEDMEVRTILNPDDLTALLPTTEGFFFGSTDYDHWYLVEIDDTIEQLERCLQLGDDAEFYYQSSW